MPTFTKFHKIAFGIATASGAVYYFKIRNDNPVKSSWTTNYTPYTKWDYNWDHRSFESQIHPNKLSEAQEQNKLNEIMEKTRTKCCRHLILIRHGQYNLDGATDEERTLTQLGREQAEWTGRRLKELGFPYTNMVQSTMTRAQETGSIIAKQLPDVPIEHCHLLREGAPVPPEPPIGSWKPEAYFFQDGARIEAAFRRYFHRAEYTQEKDSYTIIVCHANVIRYLVCRALQFPPEGWLRFSLNHASITWISITPSGRVVLRTLGDSGHIPVNLVTNR